MIVPSRKLTVSKGNVPVALTVRAPADRNDIPVMVYAMRPDAKPATATRKVNQDVTVSTLVRAP